MGNPKKGYRLIGFNKKLFKGDGAGVQDYTGAHVIHGKMTRLLGSVKMFCRLM